MADSKNSKSQPSMQGHLLNMDVEVGDMSASSSTTNEMTNHQPTLEISGDLQVVTIKRQIQEIKNNARVEQQNINKEISVVKASTAKTEARLASLQKMLASLTDKSLDLGKEIKESDKSLKETITELRAMIVQTQSELSDIKIKLTDLTRKVNANQARSGFSSGNIPDNLMEILEPYERQLGMYDVRIAELDSRFQVLESTSYTGTLVWKIQDYGRRRSEAISGKTLSLYSQPFYTSRYGYKMCARIYLNGDGMGKGTHMSLFFVVMKGEYDALLPWPFRQKVTLMLLDQGVDRRHLSDTFRPDPTSSSFKRPSSDMNIASGCPLFVAHNVIDGSTYVKDETIFLRIIVDTTDLDNL